MILLLKGPHLSLLLRHLNNIVQRNRKLLRQQLPLNFLNLLIQVMVLQPQILQVLKVQRKHRHRGHTNRIGIVIISQQERLVVQYRLSIESLDNEGLVLSGVHDLD